MVEEIAREELYQRTGQRNCRIIEISSGETFERAHIPGAVQMTLHEIDSRFNERFPNRAQEIILYGLSASSPDPLRAAHLLVAIGYERVLFYRGGKEEWMLSRLPVETIQYGSKEELRRSGLRTGFQSTSVAVAAGAKKSL